jgi:YbgC/YbaW family acyl-CoA thioester hydrolase
MRLHLDLPEKFLFRTELTVRINDLNYGAHVGNDNLLTLLAQARIDWYRWHGFADEKSFEGSVGHVIADVLVLYKAEAFLGDVLVIEIAVADVGRANFDFLYRVSQKGSGQEVARAKTGMVCFDFTTRKVAAIPSALRKIIASH